LAWFSHDDRSEEHVMSQCGQIRRKTRPAPEAIAIHLLRAWTTAQIAGERVTLDDLVERLRECDAGVRRDDVRRTVSSLDAQGCVDALRMRLTLAGFAIGRSLLDAELQPLRAGEIEDYDSCAA
jgi:hypothetical protein